MDVQIESNSGVVATDIDVVPETVGDRPIIIVDGKELDPTSIAQGVIDSVLSRPSEELRQRFGNVSSEILQQAVLDTVAGIIEQHADPVEPTAITAEAAVPVVYPVEVVSSASQYPPTPLPVSQEDIVDVEEPKEKIDSRTTIAFPIGTEKDGLTTSSETYNSSEIRASVRTHLGKVREQNEDNFIFVSSDEGFRIGVLDGVGGHSFGEKASAIAATRLSQTYLQGNLVSVSDALRFANTQIIDELDDSGTTAVVADIRIADDGKYIAEISHVGDSRAYVMGANRESFIQVTKDHSKVQEEVDKGKITPEEARLHPDKNQITRSVGDRLDVEIESRTGILNPGDLLVLTSDGVTDMLTDRQLAEILTSSANPVEATDRIIEAANAAGGHDNITVAVIEVPKTK